MNFNPIDKEMGGGITVFQKDRESTFYYKGIL